MDAHASDIASANWHASAALIARCCREALLVDMGSTTTDIVPIVAGAVAARGYTDAERLATGELLRRPRAGAWHSRARAERRSRVHGRR